MAGSIVLNPTSLSVTPGESTVVTVQIRNTGSVVDQFAVTVLGDAASWATVSPPVVSLFPGAEGSAQVIFQPPRAATVRQGANVFGIRVVPHEDPENSVVEEGTLQVGAFTAVSARVTPRNSEGNRTAVHTVYVDNNGNTDIETEIDATDPDEAMAFDIRPSVMSIPPGGSGTATVKVAPRDKTAHPVPRPFQIIVRPGSEPPVVLDATMTQTRRRGVPRGLAPLAIGVVALALAAVILPGVLKKKDSSAGIDLAASGGSTTAPPATPPPGEAAAGGEEGAAPPTTPPPTAPKATTPPPTTAPPVTAAPKTAAPSRVVFRRFVGSAEQIMSMNIDGSDVKQLTNDGVWNTHPVWFPNHQQIAFTRAQGASDSKVWVMNADGSGKKQLTTTPNGINDSIPNVSPDGTRIAFISNRGGADFDLFVMNADGSGQVNLTNSNGVTDHWPTWAPDGKRIAWQRGAEIWVMNADGSGQNRLRAGSHPAWSPTNASLLAFTLATPAGSEIGLLDVTRPGDATPKLTNNSNSDDQPAWMADGSRIVFMSNRDGNNEIYVMDGGGGGQTRITTNASPDDVPAL